MAEKKFKLSVVIPCYNERSTIRSVVQKVLDSNVGMKIEIVVVDDFSSDGSRELIEEMHRESLISKFIFQSRNRGKGAALREGFKVASGDIIIVQDADLECDPSEYPKLVEPIISNVADVVYGSRFLCQSPRVIQSYKRTLANKFLTVISNMFTDFNLTDMETCYKVFKKEVLNQVVLKEDRFGFEPEVTAKISKLPIRIVEVAISYNPRSFADGKKIRARDGLRAIWVILKYSSSRSNKRNLENVK